MKLRLFCCSILLVISACSGLAGEPRIIATIAPATPDTSVPSSAPDIAQGAQIFAARCTSCHGIGGAGDGDFVASGQITNPGNFTLSAAAEAESPRQWFNTITYGRIENLMPPWENALTEQERWNVAFYSYTLHYSPAQILQGREIVTNNAAVAAEMQPFLPQFSDQAAMVGVSDVDLLERLLTDAPALTSLTVDEQFAVLSYVRSVSVTNPQAVAQIVPAPTTAEISTPQIPPAAPTPIPGGASTAGTVSGQVTNGTALGTVPPDTIVTLHMVNQNLQEVTASAQIGADGTFIFTSIPIMAGNRYYVTTTYREQTFNSAVVEGTLTTPSLNLPVTIYELTEDPGVLSIIGVVTQITTSANANGIDILQVFRFSNNSDRTYISTNSTGDGRFASVLISLPPGAVILGFQGGERYIVGQEQGAVIDTLPVLPGDEHFVQIAYYIPYENGAILEQRINYPLNGTVRILVGAAGLAINSEQLPSLGPETIAETTYNAYGGTLGLQPGDLFRYEVTGQFSTSTIPTAITAENLLPALLIGAGILVLVVAGIVYSRSQRNAVTAPASEGKGSKNRLMDALVRQIAELDDQHDRGAINHDVYQRQRKQLKDRLAQLLAEKAQ